MKNTRKLFLIGLIIILMASMFINYNTSHKAVNPFKIISAQKSEASAVIDNVIINDKMILPPTSWAPYKEKVEVKGIYLTGHTIGYTKRFNQLVELVNKTELNAMVIDVKDDKGEVVFDSDLMIVDEFGADNRLIAKDFREKMKTLRENNIYTIARIVTFKDKLATASRPDLAIKSRDGQVWRDKDGNAWLNPYNRDTWEYPIKLAEEAAQMGFKEIQFDYVRFPTDGNRAIIDYGEAGENITKSEAIASFLKYARERLAPKGVYVSADIFGLVTTVSGDMGIGQHLETLAMSTDILSPMVYPSHYALGSYGVAYPDANPYSIVYASMSKANERIKALEVEEPKAILRPWLQDFSAPWLKEQYGQHYITYGPEQIRQQIDATYDSGLREWIFWNAGNKYTEEGYLKGDS